MTWPHELAVTATRVVPGFACRVVTEACSGLPWHECDEDGLASLWKQLRARHPEAGMPYAAMRGWELLVWQPVYLAVIAVHLHHVRLDPDRVSLDVRDGEVQGCSLAGHEGEPDEEPARLRAAGAALIAGVERLWPRWRGFAPMMHGKAARWACADCAMGALRAVHPHRPDWSLDDVQEQGRRWLRALDQPGESGFIRYVPPSGGEALALVRKVCCLHFHRHDGERCAGCPKLTWGERMVGLLG